MAVLDRSANHAAGIGNEVGHDQHAALVEQRFGFGRGRNVRTFQDQLCLNLSRVLGVNGVGPRRE